MRKKWPENIVNVLDKEFDSAPPRQDATKAGFFDLLHAVFNIRLTKTPTAEQKPIPFINYNVYSQLETDEAFVKTSRAFEAFLHRTQKIARDEIPTETAYGNYAFTKDDARLILSLTYHAYVDPETIASPTKETAEFYRGNIEFLASKLKVGKIREFDNSLITEIRALNQAVKDATPADAGENINQAIKQMRDEQSKPPVSSNPPSAEQSALEKIIAEIRAKQNNPPTRRK